MNPLHKNLTVPDLEEKTRMDSTRGIAIQVFLKRVFDVFFSATFFLLFGWIYLIVWSCVIATTGRPAIYKHKRVGKGGKEFECLKFRSMVVNSDELLKKHLEADPAAREEWNKEFKLKNDPRITKFGKILRRTSLDELPQFWNVLRGDMSVVGPRPVVKRELHEAYGSAAPYYLSVKPGITGPWQIGGRSDLAYTERVQLDAFYAQNWSVWGDIKIVIKTVAVVLNSRGSY